MTNRQIQWFERSRGGRKAGSCVTRLKRVSGIINRSKIRAWLLCVVMFDSSGFPPHGPGSLCFGNIHVTAMTHTSLKKTYGKWTQTQLSLWGSLTENRARLLNSLPTILRDAIISTAKVRVMAKVGLLHGGHFQYLVCLTCQVHLAVQVLHSVLCDSC